MKFRDFDKKLIDWYKRDYRPLPWRNIKDPYKIWLSEIILQQTRVTQGLPYYEKFINKYPTLTDLAHAADDDVLRTWQGLGYYSRARNLLKCARTVAFELKGKFPEEYEDLKKLPGIGPYTAAAIASFAFCKPVAVVDGNVFRVLSRIFGIDRDIAKPSSFNFFKEISEKNISLDRPDLYNQALMELGATVCLPKNPLCESCSFQDICFAKKHYQQDHFPLKSKVVKIRTRKFYYIFLYDEHGGFLNKRGVKDIWAEMYDFLLLETNNFSLPDDLPDLAPELTPYLSDAHNIEISDEVKHVLSHQKLEIKFIKIKSPLLPDSIELNKNKLQFYTWKEIENLPKPIIIANFIDKEFS